VNRFREKPAKKSTRTETGGRRSQCPRRLFWLVRSVRRMTVMQGDTTRFGKPLNVLGTIYVQIDTRISEIQKCHFRSNNSKIIPINEIGIIGWHPIVNDRCSINFTSHTTEPARIYKPLFMRDITFPKTTIGRKRIYATIYK
jgi:hypothetical protein